MKIRHSCKFYIREMNTCEININCTFNIKGCSPVVVLKIDNHLKLYSSLEEHKNFFQNDFTNLASLVYSNITE